MPFRPPIVARHWYRALPFTLIAVREALSELPVQARLVEPHFTQPVLADRLVAQFTVTEEPTRSVRYGYRFNSGAHARAGPAETDAVETKTRQIASRRHPNLEVVRHPVTPQPCGKHPTRPTRQGWSSPF